jgi:hypothetical protein
LGYFWRWLDRRWGIDEILAAVPDGRDPARSVISLIAVLKAILVLFVLRLGSIRAMDDLLGQAVAAPFRSFLGHPPGRGISDDSFADILSRLGPRLLLPLITAGAKRELLRWKADRYMNAILGRRILAISPSYHWLASRVVVAIDGHELFFSEHRCCSGCLTREITKKVAGKEVTVNQYYHRIVVAQWVGSHPALILGFVELRQGDNELKAAYRLLKLLAKNYGSQIDVLLADALYDGEPFRALARRLGYCWVIRQKNETIDPGKSFRAALLRRDPDRRHPDWRYHEKKSDRHYELWEETEHGYRFIFTRRTQPTTPSMLSPPVQQGACLTNLPPDKAPAAAVAMLMETRWWIENTGFHELVKTWGLDRAYVHANRSVAVTAILILALTAYNAVQTFFYRELKISPERPQRTFGDITRDFLISLGQLGRKIFEPAHRSALLSNQGHAMARGP